LHYFNNTAHRPMNLDAVHAFVAVARAGGFAAAGRALRMPRSTLSRQIQRLEAELGVRLMERTTRAVRLTEAGLGYFQRCSHALDLIDAASSGARDAGAQPRGKLRVAAPIDVARVAIATLLPDFRRRYPDIELAFEVAQHKVDLVREGFDLALRGGERLEDSSMAARKLSTFVFRLYASPSYLSARGHPSTPADLVGHDLVAFAPGGAALPWRLVGPEGPAQFEPDAWLIGNEFGLLISAMADGLGIGLAESLSIAHHVRDGRLQAVLPEYTMYGGALYAVYPSARRVPPKVRVFIALLQRHLRAGGWAEALVNA
jgi:DNA-binding transcriptional LysR family regulator